MDRTSLSDTDVYAGSGEVSFFAGDTVSASPKIAKFGEGMVGNLLSSCWLSVTSLLISW